MLLNAEVHANSKDNNAILHDSKFRQPTDYEIV